MTAWFVTALRQGSARIFTATFLFFTLSAALMAQSQSGGLRGQVLDPTGAVIPNADITLKGEAGQTVSAKSDGIGSYAIKNLPAGKYTMTVQEKGFRPNVQDLQVAAGQEQKLNITLEVYVEEEHVDVQSDAAKISVNPENNASSLVISGKDLDALSDDPDELQSELQALAGPSAGPNGGQIYIDGFTGGQLPPKASIREVRINQNPFSAEYDRMGYGRIEVFTKPGTDKMHGQFFYNDNHSIFDSANPFGAIEPSFSTQLYNGNVGGPINKKASYFFNVERRDINDAAVVPAASFADAGQTPVPVLNPRVRTNFSGRIDYQLTGNNTLTARYQFTHDDQKNNGIGGSFQPALPSQAFNETNTEHTIQISDTQILSARVVNETRFEWQRGNANQNSLTLTPAISVLGDFSGGGNPLGISDVTSTHYELQNYTSVNLGTHFFRFGGRLRATHQDNSSTQNFNGTFTFASLANFQAGQPNQLIIASGNPLVSNTYVDGGLYGEDDWKLRQNMTLSYGLRFETQNGIQDRADWAPRIGFAWGLGGKKNAAPKTVIRAGFGIFYDRFDQDLIMNAERLNGINQQRFTLNNSTPANQSLLNTLFTQFPTIPAVAGLTAVPSTTYSISPELTAPYAVQQAASVERQVTKTATATVTYLHSHGVHQLFSINTNALTPGAPPAYQYVSEGVFNQNEMIANFMVRAGAKLTLFSYYVLNYANSDSNGAGTFPSNPALGITADYGRAAFDVHNRAFFGGSVALPKGFRIFPFMVVNSGSPYNITTGSDLNGDSIFNDRPAFATGASAVDPLSPQATDFNVNPGPNDPRIPINFGQGPGQFTFNMRLSKTFGLGPKLEAAGDQNQQGGRGGPVFGGAGRGPRGGGGGRGPGGPFGERSNQRYSLTLSANARNIFNNVNPAPPIGTLSSPLFGQSTALAGGPFNTQSANRRIDFQVMFAF